MSGDIHNPALEDGILAVILGGSSTRAARLWALVSQTIPTPLAWHQRDAALVAWVCFELGAAGTGPSRLQVEERARQVAWEDAILALSVLATGSTAKGKAELRKSSTPVHEDSLLAALDHSGYLDRIATPPVGLDTPEALRAACDQVLGYHLQRQAMEITERMRKRLDAPGARERLRGILGEGSSEIVALCAQERRQSTIAQCASSAIVDADAARGQTAPPKAQWGIPVLDRQVSLRAGRLVTLAAPTGQGKTSLALQAAEATATAVGARAVAYCSLEMTGADLARIFLARETGVSVDAMLDGHATETDLTAMGEAARGIAARDIHVWQPGQSATITAVAAWVRALTVASPLRLVVIDHLQLMRGRPQQSEYDRLSEITGQLKHLALEVGCCVLCLSQFSRDGTKAKRDERGQLGAIPEPSSSDLRGSGTIEQDSDAVVLLWPRDRDPIQSVVTAKIAKNRGGPTGEADMMFHRANGQRFSECPPTAKRAMPTEISDAEDVFAV